VQHRPRAISYLRHVVRHPLHVMFVMCFLPVMVLFAWSIASTIAAVLAEALVLCVIHRVPAFQRWVDDRAREVEARQAAAARAEILSRLSDGHRAELHRLERIADAIRQRVREDCFGIGHMLSAYVGGALAHAAARARLSTTDRVALESSILSLEDAAMSGRTEGLRAIAVERLRIARMRAARWDRSKNELEVMQQQLGLIGDLIELTHDNATAPRQSPALSDALRRAMAAIPEAERTIYELVEVLDTDEAPDPRLLEMGRHAPAPAERSAPPVLGPGVAQQQQPAA
jgi:hypothetical protein